MIPVPKTTDLTNINNFRPISLLSVLSKPLEKHVHKHLLAFLEKRSLLHQHQSGFRPLHSCHTALLRMVNSWANDINDGNMAGAVFLDFRKAFDLIDHKILLQKLHIYLNKNSPAALNFFESYLASRRQTVYVNGNYSSEKDINLGVPQGSILGPLLFCIFINDLPLQLDSTHTECDMFADDTTLHSAGKTVPEIRRNLQESIEQVSQWCLNNCMLINPLKTKSMLITTRQKHQLRPQPLDLMLGSAPVEQLKEHRLLGVMLDEDLSWQPHLTYIGKKISRKLFLLSKLKHVINLQTRKLFFYAYIRPHVDFASTLWDSCSENHLKKLNSLYRRAARLILPDPSLSTDDRLKALHLLPLDKHLALNKVILVHKALNGKGPPYLRELFVPAKNHYCSSKRNLSVKRPRIDLFKCGPSYSSSILWNALPPTVQGIASVSLFKKKALEYFSNL